MKYRWSGLSHIGLLREGNEDVIHPVSSGESDDTMIAAVADGMGGHAAGEVASDLAMTTSLKHDGPPVERITAANAAVVRRAGADPELAGMGTTLTLAVLGDGVVDIGHVGDSRAYLLHDGVLSALTNDHTVVAEMVANGQIPAAEAFGHPYRNLVTRAVGLDSRVQVDSVQAELSVGDRFLLCSDGLSGMIDDQRISAILAGGDDPQATARDLVAAANAAGGHDNVSVVVVDIVG